MMTPAPKEQQPRKLSGNRTAITITFRRAADDCVTQPTEGASAPNGCVNLSGSMTEGVRQQLRR